VWGWIFTGKAQILSLNPKNFPEFDLASSSKNSTSFASLRYFPMATQ
jgi:hypothetical protein